VITHEYYRGFGLAALKPRKRKLARPKPGRASPGLSVMRSLMRLFGGNTMEPKANRKYVIVRTYSAGVFAGNLESRKGQEVVLTDARRLWYWAGAASLSQLAVTGTSRPSDCKFPVAVPRVQLLQAIEILDVSVEAEASIKAVKIWEQ
jgi:hypothetical protein